ncbi:hypothetical protein ATANTOWER_012345 [Ataeniobius toweri]|uniref:Uncharacterized protein n=1 Tax=Ataeniobius toweri TaxID=208326 RepID=A0ABU7A2F9_9TELE|nr:hypothetical protein [Ataeniobius toweri]
MPYQKRALLICHHKPCLSKSPEKPPPSFRFAVHHGAKRDADFNEPETVMLGFFAQEPSRMSLEILLVSMPSRS